MTTATANLPTEKPTVDLSVLEKVVIQGDLSVLTPQERLFYYNKVCESVGLNPLTKPFDYLELDGKLVLYAKKDCTDQLRKIHNISITITGRERIGDVYCVTARATMPDGRCDESIGAVPLLKKEMVWDPQQYNKKTQKNGCYVWTGKMIPLTPEELANALMKAETKAKRRATLSICGLGMLDESEIETVEGAQRIVIEDEPVQLNKSGSKQETKAESRRSQPSKPTEPVNTQGKPEPQGMEPKPEPETANSGGGKMGVYRLVDAKVGTSPGGVTFAQLKIANVNTGEVEVVIAKTPETMDAFNAIRNDSTFEVNMEIENGFKIVKSIRLLGDAA
ncbi:MAG: hypothetical protein BAA01_00120 [Bacillus thermozeamaize]|uniref:Uncharacterized protein n=1 Tax=Bacillus thermozeamaize TaxID=230954 RepID=A0A1Y3PGI1_9BACI|nr:MAG: hypothetical protein BAA01_00120 [Bacillus thermozeamaize]